MERKNDSRLGHILNNTELNILKMIDPVEAATLNNSDPIDVLHGSRKIDEFLVWSAGIKAFLNVLGTTGKINGEGIDQLREWADHAEYYYNAEYLDIFPEVQD